VGALVDDADLAMLAAGFEAALGDDDPGRAEAAMFELGWDELLATTPWRAMAMAFSAMGATTARAALIDDVVAHVIGARVSPTTCVVLPPPHRAAPPGHRSADRIVVDGVVTSRVDRSTHALLCVRTGEEVHAATVDVASLPYRTGPALDPTRAYRRLQVELDPDAMTAIDGRVNWAQAVAAGRTALAHELVAGARTMLAQARDHAVDRMQFGRPIASFQAVRHRLADSLVHIEAAAAVVDACDEHVDGLVPALAKSLAGKAARATATNAQQVLGGVGFTTEHPFQRWLKRTLVVDTVLGSASSLPSEIGAELARRGGAPRLVEL
jgi:hypothetical protein